MAQRHPPEMCITMENICWSILVVVFGSETIFMSIYLLYFCWKPLDTEIQGPNLFEKRFDRNGFS